MSLPVFYASDLDRQRIVLDGPEGRHAATVRRLRTGEELEVVDGRGTRCRGAVTSVGRDTVTVEVSSRVVEPEPTPRITLVQALAKGDRGELAVELATEVGVDAVVPWLAARCVQQWHGERGERSLERWRSTAREAAKQSRRAWWPEVAELARTKEVAALPGRLLVLHEAARLPLTEVLREPVGDPHAGIVLVVGPEGGMTMDELDVLGGTQVLLGPTVLRTSTAGAAAAAVVSAATGRW